MRMKQPYETPSIELFTWTEPLSILAGPSISGDKIPIIDMEEGGEMPDTDED